MPRARGGRLCWNRLSADQPLSSRGLMSAWIDATHRGKGAMVYASSARLRHDQLISTSPGSSIQSYVPHCRPWVGACSPRRPAGGFDDGRGGDSVSSDHSRAFRADPLWAPRPLLRMTAGLGFDLSPHPYAQESAQSRVARPRQTHADSGQTPRALLSQCLSRLIIVCVLSWMFFQ